MPMSPEKEGGMGGTQTKVGEAGPGVGWPSVQPVLSVLPSVYLQPHLQSVLLAHLLAGGGLLPAHDVSHQPRGCWRLLAAHGPTFCPAHCSRRPQQLGLCQPGLAFPPGQGSLEEGGEGRKQSGKTYPTRRPLFLLARVRVPV